MELALLFAVALIFGMWIGGSFARFNRSRRDLRGTTALLPGLRTRRCAAAMHSLRAGLALVGVVFVFFLGLRAAGRI